MDRERLKVMTLVGTRPEIIRLSRIIPLFDTVFEHILVHTGQNAAASLKDRFFDDLAIRAPDHYLDVDTASIGRMLGELFPRVEEILAGEKPDALLILGDTNSALACIIARKQGVPVYHMEAGNRCFDRDSPEEANRRIVDHTSDFNLPYTEAARRNLLNEGIHPKRIYLTGSPIGEIADFYRDRIGASDALSRIGVKPGAYFAASIHRQETVDDPETLAEIFTALAALNAETDRPVILSTHPRTRQKIESASMTPPEGIRFMEPFGYFDWCRLQMSAACVISDSGTVSEEAAILNFPAVTPRKSMERPEAMDCGNVILCGTSPETLVPSVRMTMHAWPPVRRTLPPEYEVRDVSHRVASLVMGTCKLASGWNC